MRTNPLLVDFDMPRFSEITLGDFLPAIESAMERGRVVIDQIINNSQTADFENTIEALEFSTYDLDRVTPILFNLNHANTSDEMQRLVLELSPLLTEFANDISLNEPLFQRVKFVYDNTNIESLNFEQKTLLDKCYKGFVRDGALLSDSDKGRYREITEQLSQLSLMFSQNLLNATNSFYLHITDERELEGLPVYAKEMGRSEAESKSLDGWVYTLAAQSYLPFMQFSDNRTNREILWTQYNTRCFRGDEYDNQQNVLKMVELRRELAHILGYNDYAQYVLEERMSKTRHGVEQFLDALIAKTDKFANADWQQIANYASEQGFDGELMPWDFTYYAEKYKSSKYDISDEKLKPYFRLESVQQGLFDVVEKLYGISFVENLTADKYHSDVIVYDVIEHESKIATLYVDYFPRDNKSAGAWMTSFQDRVKRDTINTLPIISVVCNFSKPTGQMPSLLTFGEVNTLFHEFGHALHGIFAEGDYPSISGTNVAWDFVELPSQIMENWAMDQYFLTNCAKHYISGEPLPQEYIEKLKASENFLSGYAQMRQLSFADIDMKWHTYDGEFNVTVKEFESQSLDRTRIAPKVEISCVSTAFSHIFAGGYAAGYYSYKWAEVLEADAFDMFKECGVYNRECANSFRENILSKGGQIDAMQLYVAFRGREPRPEALFEKLGLIQE